VKRFFSLKTLGHSLVWGTALAISGVAPSFAAERLNLRFGPFEQSIAVSDLEQFAQSGTVPSSLELYSAILTPEFRKALTSRLELDPNLGTRIVEDLLKSPSGQQVLNSLRQAAPELSLETLQAGFWLAARQANQLDAISVLKAIPQDTVTIDVTQALGIASQLNFSYWKTQGIQSLLTNSLPAGNPGFRASFDPSLQGNQSVREEFLSFYDAQRNRRLPVDLYWGASSANAPLIVIAPGFEANRKFLAYLARHLASHGFTVAAIEHPFVTRNGSLPSLNPDRLVPGTEFIDRPKDISFLLDRFAELNQQPGELQGKLNTQKVSMIGHSLGGYEALALAGAELRIDELRDFCRTSGLLERVPADWLQCAAAELSQNRISVRDSRIVQAIALNPAIGQIFGKEGLKSVATPTLILTSTDDTLAPAFTQQLQPFLKLPTPKYLLTAIGTTHLSVSDPGNFTGAAAQGTLVKERRGKEVEPLRRLLQGVSLAFIQQATPEAKNYQSFLTPDYARSLSKPELQMRLNTELPANLTRWLSLASVF
jgi:predicted dienelactone hydrolase